MTEDEYFDEVALFPAMKCMIDRAPSKMRADPRKHCAERGEYHIAGRNGRRGIVVCAMHAKDLAALVPSAASLHAASMEREISDLGREIAWLKEENDRLAKGYDAEEFAYERIQIKQGRRDDAQRIVYFVGRESHIKIGSTQLLDKRLKDLARGGVLMPKGMTYGPVRLLLHHKGGAAEEYRLHREFAEYRITGEWFSEGPRLMTYIERMNARVSRL